MKSNAFSVFPKSLFFKRIAPPAFLGLILGFVMLGAITGSGRVTEVPRSPATSGAEIPVVVSTPFLAAAWGQLELTRRAWKDLPAMCIHGDTVNNYQQVQCAQELRELLEMTLFALLPLFFALGLGFLAFTAFVSFYKKCDRRIASGQALFAAKVVEVKPRGRDLFAWFFALRSVELGLATERRILVYLPLSERAPEAGTRVAVFDGGTLFGKRRYIGMIYTPHIAVIA